MIQRYSDGWRQFWALSWWWKGPILGVSAFIVLIVGIAVASGGSDNDTEGQEPTPTATTATTVTPTSIPSPTVIPTEISTPEPTPAPSTPAYAATFTVTKTADTKDGTCAADCSLREAIIAANANAGADTINLPAGTYTLSIAGANENIAASGDLDIRADLTIVGGGDATTIVDGGALDRVFHIVSGTVEISGLTIRNGDTGVGGGIDNGGTLTLTNSTVSGNTAGGGGGIANGATATLTNSIVSGNTAAGDYGGISNFGTMTIIDSTISGNNGDDSVGGIYNSGTGTLTLTNSTVSGNTAAVDGGIRNDFGGTLTLNSSTVSGNTAAGDYGGISNFGTLTLTNSTVSGNTASSVGGIFNDFGGTLTLKNTIVANSPSGGDCFGTITSAGYNLDSDGTCGLAAAGDISNTDPLLGPLADNGGPTLTHALLAGSPAIDAGSPDCPPPATDQRGVVRPQGAACDIGAYEF